MTSYFKGLDKRRETDKISEAYLTAGNNLITVKQV